jgi:hypothetical protein
MDAEGDPEGRVFLFCLSNMFSKREGGKEMKLLVGIILLIIVWEVIREILTNPWD